MHLGWNSDLKKYGILSSVDSWVIQSLSERDQVYVRNDSEFVECQVLFDGKQEKWFIEGENFKTYEIEGLKVEIRD